MCHCQHGATLPASQIIEKSKKNKFMNRGNTCCPIRILNGTQRVRHWNGGYELSVGATPRKIPKHLRQRSVSVTYGDGEVSYAGVGVENNFNVATCCIFRSSSGCSSVLVIPHELVSVIFQGHLWNRGNRPSADPAHMARIISRELLDRLHRQCGGSSVACQCIFFGHVRGRQCRLELRDDTTSAHLLPGLTELTLPVILWMTTRWPMEWRPSWYSRDAPSITQKSVSVERCACRSIAFINCGAVLWVAVFRRNLLVSWEAPRGISSRAGCGVGASPMRIDSPNIDDKVWHAMHDHLSLTHFVLCPSASAILVQPSHITCWTKENNVVHEGPRVCGDRASWSTYATRNLCSLSQGSSSMWFKSAREAPSLPCPRLCSQSVKISRQVGRTGATLRTSPSVNVLERNAQDIFTLAVISLCCGFFWVSPWTTREGSEHSTNLHHGHRQAFFRTLHGARRTLWCRCTWRNSRWSLKTDISSSVPSLSFQRTSSIWHVRCVFWLSRGKSMAVRLRSTLLLELAVASLAFPLRPRILRPFRCFLSSNCRWWIVRHFFKRWPCISPRSAAQKAACGNVAAFAGDSALEPQRCRDRCPRCRALGCD